MSTGAQGRCQACGELTPSGKFCIHCGAPSQQTCPACGEPVVAGARFCLACGVSLGDAPPAPRVSTTGEPVSERRLVSVLFADLVGFTTLSEHRDPEEVRELLSTYFERARLLIERYGGLVEKFIGDAVMAVWGTPVAREDDPERAVRAALALTQMVSALGEEVGMRELRLRAGVLTGNAAVELGAEREGMVLGDTVNTASRLQSIATPGTVLVDDVTRRASEAAIAYEDAGVHEVKGREQPVRVWTALRVVAGAGGARRSAGLEAPLVGRERELETIVEAGEKSAHEGRAIHVPIVGEAGTGKSRLLWEFFKYLDGIEEVRWWHQGRCLSYGEGVVYWALAEMIRSRARIQEEEPVAAAREKLHAVVAEHVTDERERRLVEPRLAHLLGLEQRTAPDRADLFSGWRLFFERMAATHPVILAFEDLQWADSGLLDFIDYLLEWSAEFPIFVLSLGRSELLERRPEWRPLILGPLASDAIATVLQSLAPDLPGDVVQEIVARAEGIPLYAIETIRMLQDRGVLVQEGARYLVSGDVGDLDVPETLHALMASRLDGLSGAERSLLQDASVLGQSFTAAAAAEVSGRPEDEVTAVLDGLVAKQLLASDDDPRSPERGHYTFLQGLLRTVAYGTLSRKARKARHLAAAHHLERTWGEEAGEIAEVLASHYLDAVEAEPDAPDARTIRASACQTLAEAGRRATSLALGEEARRYFERAAELAEDPAVRGQLLMEAGLAAQRSLAPEDALALLTTAANVLRESGLPREAARAEGRAAEVVRIGGRLEEARERLELAYAAVDDGSDDEAVADLAAVRARIAFSLGDHDRALALADTALRIADGRRLGPILVDALITKSNVLAETGRPAESSALLKHAIELALEQDLAAQAMRGYFNLADSVMAEARFADAEELLDRGLEIARRRGDRLFERWLLAQGVLAMIALGQWDEALALRARLREEADDIWAAQATMLLPHLLAARGEIAAMRALLGHFEHGSEWKELEVMIKVGRAVILRETGHLEEAVGEARDGALAQIETALSQLPFVYLEAVECAFAADQPAVVEELLDRVDALRPAELIPLLEAEAVHARARLATHKGDAAADQWFRRAIDLLTEIGVPFLLARAQLGYAEYLLANGGDEDVAGTLRDQATAVFERLGAKPWIARAGALGTAVAA